MDISVLVKYPDWIVKLMDIAADELAPQEVRHAAIELLAKYGYALLKIGNETTWEHQLKFNE